jgi:sugar/nucleoside kinase (ribokinase family)
MGRAPGGGINALVSAARQGLDSAYAGAHGDGPNGDAVREALAREGIALLAPAVPDEDTGWCLAMVEPDGERTFVTAPGAEAALDRAALSQVRLEPGDALYVSGYDLAYPGSGPVLGAWLADLPPAADGGPWVVLDPGPLVADIPATRLGAVLARVDLLSASAGELAALSHGELWPASLAPTAVVVRRNGPNPVRILWQGNTSMCTTDVATVAPPAPVLDSNGAGDTHLGALAAALARGLTWGDAVATANRAAAWSLTRRGAASGPTLDELRGWRHT